MLVKSISLLSFLSLFISPLPAYSAVFDISSGDVAGLIAAINTANSNGEENTINLAPGTYTLTSPLGVDPSSCGFLGTNCNGLVVSGNMTINGESAATTIIERNPAAPRFRIVAVRGKLTLNKLTIRGGQGDPGGGISNAGTLSIIDSVIDKNNSFFETGGILNRGKLTLLRSIVTNNSATFNGGGILNDGGTLTITSSTIAHNFSEDAGGIQNGNAFSPVPTTGTVTIQSSTIRNNGGDGSGGITNRRMSIMTITNSTIANNFTRFTVFGPGGIANGGTLRITNSTVAGNHSGALPERQVMSGIGNGGVLELQNSIVDLCSGPITSRGNNIVADPSGCDITLVSSDLTGDPGLGAFVDGGAPGHGRFPLLETSQAIDRGNNEACSSDPALGTDQLGKPRSVAGTVDRARVCDMGAVEFFPVVNELVRLREDEMTTEFDPRPSPEAPAGTFVITARFENISNETIFFPFFEVAALELQSTIEVSPDVKCADVGFTPVPAEDQPVLLNADGGPGHPQCVNNLFSAAPLRLLGTAGARLTPRDSFTTPFEPGTTRTFQFHIGLQKQEPFTFLVNMIGEQRTSNTSVSMAGETSNP